MVAAAIFFATHCRHCDAGEPLRCAGSNAAEDGPPPGSRPTWCSSSPPRSSAVAARYLACTPVQIGIATIVVFALVACWCSDAICGIVPDVFTLPTLAALLLFAVAQRDWGMMFSAAIVFAPFARRRSSHGATEWGGATSKLVAVSGAALGAPLAVFALAAACAAAVVVHRFAGARRGPIAFAPYIAAFTGRALPLGLAH